MALKKTQNDFRHKTSEAYLRRGEEKRHQINGLKDRKSLLPGGPGQGGFQDGVGDYN